MAYTPTLADTSDEPQKYTPTLADTYEEQPESGDKSYEQFMAEQGRPTTSQFSDIARGLLGGVIHAGQGVSELEAKGLRVLGLNLPPFNKSSISNEATGVNKIVPSSQEGQAGFMTGQMIPFIDTPIGKGGAVMRGLKMFGTGEALAPVLNPEESVKKSMKEAIPYSVGGALIEPAMRAIKSMSQGFLTAGGTATSAEFAKHVEASQGKPVGIAELSQSPLMAKVEQNVLGNVIGSGVMQKDIQVGKGIQGDVHGVLDDLNTLPEKEGVSKQQQIVQNFQKNTKAKESKGGGLYTLRNEEAKNTDGSFLADKRKSTADDLLGEVQDEIDEKGHTNVSPEVIKELRSASTNNPITYKRLNFNRKAYNDLAEEYTRSGRLNDARIMKQLSKSYDEDIKNAVDQSGNENLKIAQKNADDYFRENVVPIRNDDTLYEHSRGLANPNKFISHVVSTGNYDDPESLKVVMNNLDPEFQKQFSHEYLTQGSKTVMGEKEVKADSVLNFFNKLGDETKDLMIPKDHRSTLDNASVTRRIMGGNIHAMLNPKTGYVNSITGGIAASGLLGAGITSGFAALGLSPVEATALATIATPAIARGLSEYLTSGASKKAYALGSKLKEIKPPETPINPAILLQAKKKEEK